MGHDVFDRLQFGHVVARFVWHAQVAVGQWQPLRLVARQRTAHAAFAPVVGGQGQVPVAEHGVQLLQVIECRTGGLQHVAALVPGEVLFQVEIFACSRHELPHARSLGAGHGLWVEGRLDEGQQGQLSGHLAPLQFLNDVKQVRPRALGHAQHVVGPTGIPLLAVTDQRVVQVGHGKAPADALPDVDLLLQAENGMGLEGHRPLLAHFGHRRRQRHHRAFYGCRHRRHGWHHRSNWCGRCLGRRQALHGRLRGRHRGGASR